MNILMIGLWMACALGAQAQQRDVLFRRADGQPRTWGLSVEALYGAYLLEPVPMYTGEAPIRASDRSIFSSGEVLTDARRRRSYGRYSDRIGLGFSFHLLGGYLSVCSGAFRSVIHFKTSAVYSGSSFGEFYGIRSYYEVQERHHMIEVPVFVKGSLSGKSVSGQVGIGLTKAFSQRERYEVHSFIEYSNPTPVRIPFSNGQNGIRYEREYNYVYPMPNVFALASVEASIDFRIYRWASLGILVSYDQQFSPIEPMMENYAPTKGVYRYGLASYIKFYLL